MNDLFFEHGILVIPLFYIGALVLTILVELGVVYVFRFRDKLLNKLVIWVNILTNPLLNLVIIIFGTVFMMQTDTPVYIGMLIILEAVVVYAEYRIINNIFGKKYTSKDILWVVIVMNAASFIIGEVIKATII